MRIGDRLAQTHVHGLPAALGTGRALDELEHERQRDDVQATHVNIGIEIEPERIDVGHAGQHDNTEIRHAPRRIDERIRVSARLYDHVWSFRGLQRTEQLARVLRDEPPT